MSLVLVGIMTLHRDRSPKDQGRRSPLGDLAECLAFLGAVDAVETDTLRVLVVQNLDGVTVYDAYDLASELTGDYGRGKQDYKRNCPGIPYQS